MASTGRISNTHKRNITKRYRQCITIEEIADVNVGIFK